MNYFLGVILFSNMAYLALSVARANMRVTQDYLRSPRDKHFDEIVECVVKNNKRFSDGERWVTQPDGTLVKFGGDKT